MGKSSEELFMEREKRVSDVIKLKVPDRVPLMLMFGYFSTKYTNISCRELMYNRDRLYSIG
jgi:hypothetical protein